MKKVITILSILLLVLNLTGCGEKLNIKPSEVSQIKLVEYKDEEGRFTMNIPEGWQVSTSVLPDMYFAIHAYKPETDTPIKYHVYTQMKVELMLSESMKAFEKKNFGGFKQYAIIYDAPVNADGTVAGMYRNFNDVLDYMVAYEKGYEEMVKPYLDNFEVIEEYEYNSLLKDVAMDDKIIRATYTDPYDGLLQQGLFTGTIVQTPLGKGTYSSYNVNFISAPDAEFVEYEDLLSKVFASIEFSEDWINAINSNTESSYQTARDIGNSLQATVDECNRAWEERNNTYDIISQKQSDATLGYERVFDTETGEVYKAYNGFVEEYDGKRYAPITDDMYSLTISGYIEK